MPSFVLSHGLHMDGFGRQLFEFRGWFDAGLPSLMHGAPERWRPHEAAQVEVKELYLVRRDGTLHALPELIEYLDEELLLDLAEEAEMELDMSQQRDWHQDHNER